LTPEQRAVVEKASDLNFDSDLGESMATIEVAGEKVTARYDLGDAVEFGVENGWVVQDGVVSSGSKTVILEHNPFDTSHSQGLNFVWLKVTNQARFQRFADEFVKLSSGGDETVRFKISGRNIGTNRNPNKEFDAFETGYDGVIGMAKKLDEVGTETVVTVISNRPLA
jgi:hypothetical protein